MKRVPAMVMCAATLALALGLCACGSSSASSSASSASAESAAAEASGAASSAAESADSASAASADAASSEASTAASASASETQGAASSGASESAAASAAASGTASTGETAGFDFVDECTDEHGNVTLYALTELKGWQLETLLDQQGYQWQADDCLWVRQEDGASFGAVKETGPYTQDTYNEMNEKGGGIAAIGLHVVAGYKDPEAALRGNAKCVVEDSYFDGTDGIAIFYGPSMKEYLAIIGPYTESTALFMIFSKEAVGSGMADQYLGTTVGGSFQDVWKSVTGRDSYGH